jgi:hypothetical protein
VRIIIVCQSGLRPNEAMKMSSAPSFGAPGSLIFVVVAQELKKITKKKACEKNIKIFGTCILIVCTI